MAVRGFGRASFWSFSEFSYCFDNRFVEEGFVMAFAWPFGEKTVCLRSLLCETIVIESGWVPCRAATDAFDEETELRARGTNGCRRGRYCLVVAEPVGEPLLLPIVLKLSASEDLWI